MKNVLALAILVGAASSTWVEAQEAKVRFVFKTQQVGSGFFEHQITVRGSDANRLLTPNPSDLKPYLRDAQKALADRQGYSERLYGANNHTLASGKLVESSVQDVTGRTVWSSRDPLENRNREPREVKPIRTFEADEQPDSVVGFAPVQSRATRTRRQAASQVRNSPFLKRSTD